jgi:hypothetical protein
MPFGSEGGRVADPIPAPWKPFEEALSRFSDPSDKEAV